MEANKTYNGWTNYETWCVNLWMDNEQGSQEYWRETTADAIHGYKDIDTAKYELSQTIKEYHEESAPEVSGVFADLQNAALSEVNWYEIASFLIDEVVKEEEAAQ